AILVLGWVASSTRAADSPGEAFGRLQIRPANTVALDAAQIVGVYAVSDGGLGLVSAELRDAGWEGRVLDERPDPGAPSVRLVSDAGGSSWRSLVYGRAPAGATQVRLSVASIGGEVANGTWVVGVRSPLREEQLIWWFEDADGAVLLSGSGELH
ncbi:MAG TPA: hypothetical protein VHK63_00020, partial [Candidatus Limnocylindria bacterium]|nr:hypothetical protein [Candidatus Limnocylindria bacterium]